MNMTEMERLHTADPSRQPRPRQARLPARRTLGAQGKVVGKKSPPLGQTDRGSQPNIRPKKDLKEMERKELEAYRKSREFKNKMRKYELLAQKCQAFSTKSCDDKKEEDVKNPEENGTTKNSPPVQIVSIPDDENSITEKEKKNKVITIVEEMVHFN